MKSLLKFLTCGSVDDGKSTLIGHMLYDAKLLFADQEKALQLDSELGSRDGKLDYSLLLDGLIAEREQGITIDVAYRYFTTDHRSFIVADCPGHEQYTRNMAVGAAFADVAIILVDASKGVIQQTKRHSRICSLMGIKHVILAVNKMDLIDYDQNRFNTIQRDFQTLCANLGFKSIYAIPVSATEGDNLTQPSDNTMWHSGSPLLDYLESIDVEEDKSQQDFVMPVQRVARPNASFRGFQGTIEAGELRVGDTVTVYPQGESSRVKQILACDNSVNRAQFGQAVTVQVEDEIDISRGAVLTCKSEPIVSDMFTANILWMDNDHLVAGRSFYLKCGTRLISANVVNIKYQTDINTGQQLQTKKLMKNEIAYCEIQTAEKVAFMPFNENRALGGFILINKITNMTSACGVIEHALRRANNVTEEISAVTPEMRASMKQQEPFVVWLTGLSGSGKSTLASELEKRLVAMGRHTMVLDGSNVRQGLNKNLGFVEADRVENIRRISEVAKLMNDAGLIVITAFISPYESDRQYAREIIGSDRFIEVYLSTPIEVCEQRDEKGLYKLAREKKIPNFTGISSPYEEPRNPSVVVDGAQKSTIEMVEDIMTTINHIK